MLAIVLRAAMRGERHDADGDQMLPEDLGCVLVYVRSAFCLCTKSKNRVIFNKIGDL